MRIKCGVENNNKDPDFKVLDRVRIPKCYTKLRSHPLPPTPIHSHPLPSTFTYSHILPLTTPTPTYRHSLSPSPTHSYSLAVHCHLFSLVLVHSHSFLAYSYLFTLLFNTLLLNLSPLPSMYSLYHPFPVHIQILLSNPTHHQPFQPIFSPCVLRVYVLYVSVRLCTFVFHLFMCLLIHFYALYCLCLYTLCDFACVNTSKLFMYSAEKKILMMPLFFLLQHQCFFS